LLLSALSVATLYYTRSFKDVLSRASFALAYPALALIAATLLLGPWNILRKRKNPVSSDLRRDIGIWAGILSLLHTPAGQCVHLRGRPWLYYFYRDSERHTLPFRHDLFGFANYTGLISALILIALLATSNDYSLRILGTPRWKQLQRWNYGLRWQQFIRLHIKRRSTRRFPLSLLPEYALWRRSSCKPPASCGDGRPRCDIEDPTACA